MTKENLMTELTRLDYQMFEAEKALSYAQTKDEIKKCNSDISYIRKQIKEIVFQLEFCA